jgi:hypothetical protein
MRLIPIISAAGAGALVAFAAATSTLPATAAILPTCCAVCPPSPAEFGRIAALKHLRSRLT